jgi:hypothetical protein
MVISTTNLSLYVVLQVSIGMVSCQTQQGNIRRYGRGTASTTSTSASPYIEPLVEYFPFGLSAKS